MYRKQKSHYSFYFHVITVFENKNKQIIDNLKRQLQSETNGINSLII
jgi:hypothetical protein